MTDAQFLAKIHADAPKDKWGWSHHGIDVYMLGTNGVAWTCRGLETHRRFGLKRFRKAYDLKQFMLGPPPLTNTIGGQSASQH